MEATTEEGRRFILPHLQEAIAQEGITVADRISVLTSLTIIPSLRKKEREFFVKELNKRVEELHGMVEQHISQHRGLERQ